MDTSSSSNADFQLARLAGAIAEPARARMLSCLMDGHARTATELAAVAEVAASTASAHLARLKEERLVELLVQGKHRYFRLAGDNVAAALESLMVVAGTPRAAEFKPNTPSRLRTARTCYDHMAGTIAVRLHDHFAEQGWLATNGDNEYALTPEGEQQFVQLGLDLQAMRKLRRRFACPCLDWSERRPHLGGALGAALLQLALKKGWVEQDLDSRALSVPPKGQRQMLAAFGLSTA